MNTKLSFCNNSSSYWLLHVHIVKFNIHHQMQSLHKSKMKGEMGAYGQKIDTLHNQNDTGF